MPSEKISCRLWLRLQCQMVTGVLQGVLVKLEESKTPTTLAIWPEGSQSDGDVAAVVSDVIVKGRTCLKVDGDKNLIVGRPVEINKTFWGVAIVRLTPRDRIGVSAATKLLQWGETWLQYVLYQPRASVPAEVAFALVQQTAREGSLKEAAITLVNQITLHFGADRVCLGLMQGKRVHLQAVSHSANFDERQPAMQAVMMAMNEAVNAGRSIALNQAKLPPHETALPGHARLVRSDDVSEVHSLLLQNAGQTIGVLQLTGRNGAELGPGIQAGLTPLLPVLAQALELKKAADRGPARQLLAGMGRGLAKAFGPGRMVAKAVMAVAVLAVGTLFLPAQYRISAQALLQGTQKYVVVASQDSYLASVEVRPGDLVRKGQVLAKLNDDDLRLQRQKLQSELQQFRHAYNNSLAKSERAQAAIAEAQVNQALIELDLVEKQLERTLLRAPMDGLIVSEDISQSVGAPVKQGDLLLEIASAEQYRVMLYINERDIGFINEQQPGQLVLTGLPGDLFDFKVIRITPISEIRDGSNHFRVEAELQEQTEALRWGMTGTGKVDVGRHRFGWIVLHDVFDWFRLRFWW